MNVVGINNKIKSELESLIWSYETVADALDKHQQEYPYLPSRDRIVAEVKSHTFRSVAHQLQGIIDELLSDA